ncbi:hypothetical protein OH764_22650 [Burkholderia sp. M6-3]
MGIELASEVADRLDAGYVLAHGHAYYCGMGLTKYGDAYIYSVVEDGEVITPKSGEEFARVVAVAGGKMFKSFYRLSPGGAERFYTPMFAGPDA